MPKRTTGTTTATVFYYLGILFWILVFCMALAALILSALLYSKFNNGTLCGSCINGTNGRDGTNGIDGINGTNGTDGATGPQGPPGPQGPIGLTGSSGTNGTNGTVLDFADFYATMPGKTLSFLFKFIN